VDCTGQISRNSLSGGVRVNRNVTSLLKTRAGQRSHNMLQSLRAYDNIVPTYTVVGVVFGKFESSNLTSLLI